MLMKISEMIRQALEKKGFKNLKDASKVLRDQPGASPGHY